MVDWVMSWWFEPLAIVIAAYALYNLWCNLLWGEILNWFLVAVALFMMFLTVGKWHAQDLKARKRKKQQEERKKQQERKELKKLIKEAIKEECGEIYEKIGKDEKN